MRDVEAGETGVAVCRKYGISQQTLYLWRRVDPEDSGDGRPGWPRITAQR